MPPVRPHLSITLPRNFEFHYTDSQPPRTPEPETCPEIVEPPKLPRQTFRVRRRRPGIPTYAVETEIAQDLPVPTIEAPRDPYSLGLGGYLLEPRYERDNGYLSPSVAHIPMISPPRTPVAQLSGSEKQSQGESISRPSSSCSGFSDSSASSHGSMASFPSYGESLTSPDSDASDPFIFSSNISRPPMPSSPLQGYQERPNKRAKVGNVAWTDNLDNHLWITYMRYLQDATVTPFKMLPGVAPPLGVCHRVVREAKRTWRGPRSSTLQRDAAHLRPHQKTRKGSPDTIKPTNSGETTPTTAADAHKPYPQWPRSKAARQRLRYLCKRKPSLSAHYQRLLHCRTPSPFPSSPQSDSRAHHCAEHTSPASHADVSSFSTRDMNISLSTSTSITMQPNNPLSQLAVEDAPTTDTTPRKSGSDPFNEPPARTPGHHKSQSLDVNFGTGALGSPFAPTTQKFGSYGRAAGAAPKLDSPLELPAPVPRPRSFKRRFNHDPNATEDQRGSVLEELFAAPSESSHRRVRSRGFSLGDVGESSHRLTSLFTPPSMFDQLATPESSQNMSSQANLLSPLTVEPTRRLGSPFVGRSSNVRLHNTFPRHFTPHGLGNS